MAGEHVVPVAAVAAAGLEEGIVKGCPHSRSRSDSRARRRDCGPSHSRSHRNDPLLNHGITTDHTCYDPPLPNTDAVDAQFQQWEAYGLSHASNASDIALDVNPENVDAAGALLRISGTFNK